MRRFIVYFPFMRCLCESRCMVSGSYISILDNSRSIFIPLFNQGEWTVDMCSLSMMPILILVIWKLPGTTLAWYWCQQAAPPEQMGLRLGLIRFKCPSSRLIFSSSCCGFWFWLPTFSQQVQSSSLMASVLKLRLCQPCFGYTFTVNFW